jgi:hypothetical protein
MAEPAEPFPFGVAPTIKHIAANGAGTNANIEKYTTILAISGDKWPTNIPLLFIDISDRAMEDPKAANAAQIGRRTQRPLIIVAQQMAAIVTGVNAGTAIARAATNVPLTSTTAL